MGQWGFARGRGRGAEAQKPHAVPNAARIDFASGRAAEQPGFLGSASLSLQAAGTAAIRQSPPGPQQLCTHSTDTSPPFPCLPFPALPCPSTLTTTTRPLPVQPSTLSTLSLSLSQWRTTPPRNNTTGQPRCCCSCIPHRSVPAENKNTTHLDLPPGTAQRNCRQAAHSPPITRPRALHRRAGEPDGQSLSSSATQQPVMRRALPVGILQTTSAAAARSRDSWQPSST
jgi:hypothetical protein